MIHAFSATPVKKASLPRPSGRGRAKKSPSWSLPQVPRRGVDVLAEMAKQEDDEVKYDENNFN